MILLGLPLLLSLGLMLMLATGSMSNISSWQTQFDQWLSGGQSAISAIPKKTLKPNSKQTVYRWQDDRGHWHFAEQPPSQAGIDYEALIVSDQVTTIQMPKPKSMPRQADSSASDLATGFRGIIRDSSRASSEDASDESLASSPEALLKKAQQLRETLNQRDDMLNSL
ncbi:MAG: DUF4124 domain-containing protein [Pseudomonadales bacterium]|nr:DUF4124 domain-containing protein [Pseudomonadales bacterium]